MVELMERACFNINKSFMRNTKYVDRSFWSCESWIYISRSESQLPWSIVTYFPLVTVYCHFLETFTSLGSLFLHCYRGWDQSQRKVFSFHLYPFLLQLMISSSSVSKPERCEGHPYCGLQSTRKAFQKSNLFDYCLLDSFQMV